MKCYCASLIIFNIVLAILGKVVGTLGGGGRLFYPPGRSSLWRFNYTNVPINEKDNTINCGGFKVCILQLFLTHFNFCSLEYGSEDSSVLFPSQGIS